MLSTTTLYTLIMEVYKETSRCVQAGKITGRSLYWLRRSVQHPTRSIAYLSKEFRMLTYLLHSAKRKLDDQNRPIIHKYA